jgi:hypothetical protein
MKTEINQRINVLDDDIIKGIRNDPCKCMIARAIRRQVPGAFCVYVHPKDKHTVTDATIMFKLRGKRTFKAILPYRANAAAIIFDDLENVLPAERPKKVKPFSFALRASVKPI